MRWRPRASSCGATRSASPSWPRPSRANSGSMPTRSSPCASPAAEGDRVAREAPRISGAIEVLMMVLDVVEHGPEMAERREDLDADADVVAHVILLVRRETGGFVEHRFARADLADVVQAAGEAHGLDRVGIEPEFARDGRGQLGDALRVAPQEDALGLHRIDERLGDLDRHVAEHVLLALQLAGSQRHLIADEPFHAALFPEQT